MSPHHYTATVAAMSQDEQSLLLQRTRIRDAVQDQLERWALQVEDEQEITCQSAAYLDYQVSITAQAAKRRHLV